MAIQEPVKWAKDRKSLFIGWFYEELVNTMGDRGPLELKWRQQLVQWRARVIGDGVTDVPFAGASDVEMPITGIHVDPVFADFMQTLHVPQDFWSVVAKRPDMVDSAKPLQEFLSLVEQEDIDMFSVNEMVLHDSIIHGTGIYKHSIVHEAKKVKDYDEAGNITDRVMVRFKPTVEHVPLPDFFIPAYSKEIDPDAPQRGAPWVAQRFDQREGQLRIRAEGQSPFMPNYDKKAVEIALNWQDDRKDDDVEQTQRDEDEYKPWRDRKIELWEVWARWDVDGDGIEEDIRVIYHHHSRQILQATHNPFMHGHRPFEKIDYMPGKGFYGIGIAEMDEWAQIVSTRILNATVDSAFLGNATMMAAPLGMGITPDEPIFPGKIWLTGPNEKVEAIKMGSADPAMFQLLGAFAEFAEKRTGVGEMRQGSIEGLPSRTPASSVLSILNEGKKRFDLVLTAMRKKALKRLGIRLLQNLIQISRDDPRYLARAIEGLGPEDGQKVIEILSGRVHDVEALFGISVTATSSQVNKEVEKQSLIGLMQLLLQLNQQEVQYAQALTQLGGDPSLLLGAVQAAYNGIGEMKRRMLEAHDIQNPQQYASPIQQQQAPLPALGAAPAGVLQDPTQVGTGAPPGANLLSLVAP